MTPRHRWMVAAAGALVAALGSGRGVRGPVRGAEPSPRPRGIKRTARRGAVQMSNDNNHQVRAQRRGGGNGTPRINDRMAGQWLKEASAWVAGEGIERFDNEVDAVVRVVLKVDPSVVNRFVARVFMRSGVTFEGDI